jgi:hypothetical protein
MNVDLDKLLPGTFGVSHGSGAAGMLIRDATGSWAGHAFLYLGGGMIVEGQPPAARLTGAGSHADAIWAYRMWDQLKSPDGPGGDTHWTDAQVAAAQAKVVARGHALVGCAYDWPAYVGFAAEILHLRKGSQLDAEFAHDEYRVCSALVADALDFGAVPLNFVPEDGPSLDDDGGQVRMPPNLVAPGMLLGLAQRLDWA